MKTCTNCLIAKPIDDFYLVKGIPMHNCRECKNKKDLVYYHKKGGAEKVKQRRQKNLHAVRQKEREWRGRNPERAKGKILQKYWPGTSWKEALALFNELKLAQLNLCAICGNAETAVYNKHPSKGKIRDLCVDHCHTTGVVRGLLCDNCNVMIARAKDMPAVCISAANYLSKGKK